MTSPRTGDEFAPGSNLTVSWQDFPTDSVRMLLYTVSGTSATFTTAFNINATVPTSRGQYVWTVPAQAAALWAQPAVVAVAGVSGGVLSGYQRTSGIFTFRGQSVYCMLHGACCMLHVACCRAACRELWARVGYPVV